MAKGQHERYGLVLDLLLMATLLVLEVVGAAHSAPVARVHPANPPADTAQASVTAHRVGMGEASYYGYKFAGRPTASGETFNPKELTAAHRSLPFGTRVRVTNLRNGEAVVVRINDRGPFVRHRIIDVSRAAARRLGMLRRGKTRVRLEVLRR